MDGKGVSLGIAEQQRVGAQSCNRLVKQVGISSYRSQHLSQFLCPLSQQLLRDSVRREKSAQPQQLRRSRVALPHLFKSEGPGRGHGFWVISNDTSTVLQEFYSSRL